MALKDIVKNKPKQQRYIAIGKLEAFKKQGWTVAEIKDEKMKKIIDRNKDLVLVEK